MTPREQLLDRVRAGFVAAYGAQPQAVYSAPGRVNLIGEHTDYNEGLVFPCAIDRETMIAVGPGVSAGIEAVALDLGGARDAFGFGEEIKPKGEEWCDHLRGMAQLLSDGGCEIPPLRLAIAGNVPMGAGLSSSASLGVATGLALASEAGMTAEPETLARIAQMAENHFVGTQCGIMDQMASACSVEGHALLLDCRNLTYRHIEMPSSLALVIIDSGVRHSLGDSPYAERRAQCEAAAEHYEVPSLRTVSPDQLERKRGGLGAVEYARARHVVSEIERVSRFAWALMEEDHAAISALMAESFVSYRDDFDASVPEIDRLFDRISAVLGTRGGVRLTGGGFGGSLVALAPPELVPEIAAAAGPCDVGVFRPSRGAHRII